MLDILIPTYRADLDSVNEYTRGDEMALAERLIRCSLPSRRAG